MDRAVFREAVRQYLKNKVITHDLAEFVTPEGDTVNIPIDLQFVSPPPEPEEFKIKQCTNPDDFLTFFDSVLDEAEKEIKEATRVIGA